MPKKSTKSIYDNPEFISYAEEKLGSILCNYFDRLKHITQNHLHFDLFFSHLNTVCDRFGTSPEVALITFRAAVGHAAIQIFSHHPGFIPLRGGHHILIIGRPGSGKSSAAKLLYALIDQYWYKRRQSWIDINLQQLTNENDDNKQLENVNTEYVPPVRPICKEKQASGKAAPVTYKSKKDYFLTQQQRLKSTKPNKPDQRLIKKEWQEYVCCLCLYHLVLTLVS